MNSYEMLARERKARKLAHVIHGSHVTAADMRSADDAAWALCEEEAKVNKASAETRQLVIEFLEEMEKAVR